MTKLRVFVGIELSDEIVRNARGVVDELQQHGAIAKWVDPQNLHLTLNFLGEVNETEVHEVCAAVIATTRGILRFEWTCRGVGAFPNFNRPRTIWLGVQEGSEQTIALQHELAQALDEIGFPKENRRFTPHITLGRVRGKWNKELTEIVDGHKHFEAGRSAVNEVVVFSSHLSRSGPQYDVLSRAPLT